MGSGLVVKTFHGSDGREIGWFWMYMMDMKIVEEDVDVVGNGKSVDSVEL